MTMTQFHMNHRFSLIALLLGVLLCPLALTTAVADETEIAKQMGIINDNHKKLRRTARTKEFNEESLKQVAEMIKASEACKEHAPAMASDMKGPEKEKFIAAYKKSIDGMIEQFKSLEAAIKEKKMDDAVALVEKLSETKKKGHDEFTKE